MTEHLLTVDTDEDGLYPQCTCGWAGVAVYDTEEDATDEWATHALHHGLSAPVPLQAEGTQP